MENGPELWDAILSRMPKGAVVAGGAVRDYLLGVPPKDIDVFWHATAVPQTDIPFDLDCIQPDPRSGLWRIDSIFERKEEYEALNDILLVSRGQLFGFTVDLIELSVPFDVASFDFGINHVWYDGTLHDTEAAFNDRFTLYVTLHHADRLERSRKRFARFNERHGGKYVLKELPCQ